MKQSSKNIELAGKTLTLETGVLAQQATAAVTARMGDTMVIATVVMGRNDTTLDYFPLSVEYVERLYAGGRIKGSKWVKREGRPSDDAVLNGRIIDRSIRPLFPKELKKDVQVVITVLSVDGENDPAILGVIATSAALSISKIPWAGPIGATKVGVTQIEGNTNYVVNPTSYEGEPLVFETVISSVNNKIVMIEAEGTQASEEIAYKAMMIAKEWNGKIVEQIEAWVKEVGEEKISVSKDQKREEYIAIVEKSYKQDIENLIKEGVNKEVGGALDEISNKIADLESNTSEDVDKKKIKDAVDYVFKKTIRELILKDGQRPDGRKLDQVRPLDVKVGVLPRTHGSAVFQRGETQVLTAATLAPSSYEQLIEGPEGEEIKRYMHHYSFPPYSVGETGRIGFTNRREIGHGALAEKALVHVIPPVDKFPYAIRLVSEVMSSNGSTSQASICASTLALMDAGVPIIAPVAGIAMGLMAEKNAEGYVENGKYQLLTDIAGLEDFSGDMDFKVAGTKDGITAIQLDVKIDGLTDKMVEETLAKAKDARIFILDKMISVLPEARKDVSQYAPKIKMIQIPVEKIGEVIGSGGKTIKNIIATTGAQVDVEDDGKVSISAVDEASVDKAVYWIETLTRDIQAGEVFEGKVKRIVNFGAFVEIVPGKEGLVHVSEMSTEYVANPEDVVKLGQTVKVRVKEIDDMGRTNLSMLFGEDAEKKKEGGRGGEGSGAQGGGREERPRRDDRRSSGGGGRRDDRRDFRKGPPSDNFPKRDRR